MVLISVALTSGREDYAQQSIAGEVRYVGTGIKEQLIGSAAVAVTAKRQVPQAGYYYDVVVRIGEGAEKGSGVRVKGVDFAVFDIADQEGVAEVAEMGWRAGDSPRVDEGTGSWSVGGKMVWGKQVAVRIKNVHHAAERWKEPAEGHKELAILVLDLEGGVAGVLNRNARVGE